MLISGCLLPCFAKRWLIGQQVVMQPLDAAHGRVRRLAGQHLMEPARRDADFPANLRHRQSGAPGQVKGF